jgi:hypothetical protein
LDRRAVLRLLAASTALPIFPAGALATFRGIHNSLPAAPSLKAFNEHQNATAVAMADLILPTTETPGAKDVRVNEFMDHIVADWYTDEERALFLAGLADVDKKTQALFQKDFVDAGPTQQAEILRALGDELAGALETVADGPRGYRGSTPEPEGTFYLMFRQLTLTGYFTSEAGFTQALHEEIIPGKFDGCVQIAPATPSKGA